MPLHVSSTMCSSSGGQNCIIQPLVSLHLKNCASSWLITKINNRCCYYETCFPRNICVARAIKEGTQYLDAKTVKRRTLKLFTSLFCSLVF